MVTRKEDSTHGHKADLLLVTVTEVEARAVLDVFAHVGNPDKKLFIGENTYFDLGVIGGTRTFMVQSDMGASGPGGATLVIYEGIKDLSPSAVIMVGIAFGLIPDKQHLGDILISRQLVGYELQKIDQGANGEEIIIPRGDRVQASPRLLSRLRASIFDWQGPEVHFGLMFSGEKLVNNKNFCNKLLGLEREAIGGEMEGTGLYSAAYRNKVDWVLIKAICDWADGHKDTTCQKLAAENAARFILHVLKQDALSDNNDEKPPPSQTQDIPPLKRPVGTILCTYHEHASWVLALDWEPDGDRIASGGGDGVVRIWDANTAHTLLTYRGHKWLDKRVNWLPKIYTLAWSPEGLRVASAGDGKKVYVWDATTGQTITEYSGHSAWLLPNVFALAWSPKGNYIASACSAGTFDKTVHIWNAKSGETKLRYNSSYGAVPDFSVSSIAWSPDGQRIASACGSKTIRLWDATYGKTISTFKTSSAYIYIIAWSPDGQRLALANGNATAEILDASNGRILLTYRGHQDGVRDIAWSPDGKHIATASNDTTVQIWNATSGQCLYTHEEHASMTTSVVWSPDGTRIASCSNDKTVQIWQAV